ncbi:MAG TPA: hypothetical protein VMK12_13800 [Anaeromyxobacteraceae bacterium]|nr:hypothetical protein [Anaeromyxobacteraceae bacterium]
MLTKPIALSVALSALLASGVARADGVTYVPVTSVYQDSKEAPLKGPEGVACADSGAIAIADTGNGRLLMFTFKDGALSGGTEVKLAEAPYPVRLQFDSKGNVLVLDRKTHHILRLDGKGALLGPVEVKHGVGKEIIPAAFKLDSADNLYVLDAASGAVVAQDANGSELRRLDAPKGAIFTDIAVDNAGTVYATDEVGTIVYSAPKDAKAFSAITPSLKDRMSFPSYIAAYRGRLTLVDQNGSGLVILGTDGSFQGRHLSMGWSDGFLYYPSQVCFPGTNYVLIADRGNNRVQLFSTGD